MTKTTSSEPFPLDWHDWDAAWRAWHDEHRAVLKRPPFRFPGKNFMADEVLGTFKIDGTVYELAVDACFLGKRHVGVTAGTSPTDRDIVGIAESFADLERILGLTSDDDEE